jgi:hypothetical protein
MENKLGFFCKSCQLSKKQREEIRKKKEQEKMKKK